MRNKRKGSWVLVAEIEVVRVKREYWEQYINTTTTTKP